MSSFSIITDRTANLAGDFLNYHSKMADYIDEVNNIASIIRNESSINFDGSLYQIGLMMTENCEELSNAHSALVRIVQRYSNAERKNSNYQNKKDNVWKNDWLSQLIEPGISNLIFDYITRIIPPSPRPQPWSLLDILKDPNFFETVFKNRKYGDEGEISNDFFTLMKKKVNYKWNFETNKTESTGKWGAKDKVESIDSNNAEVNEKGYYDSNTGKWVKKDKINKMDTDVKWADGKNSLSYTGLHFDGTIDIKDETTPFGLNDNQYKLEVDGLKGEVYTEAYAALKGVGIGAGLEATALSIALKKRQGTDDYNLFENTKIDIGKVELGAGAKVGLDQENKLGAYVDAKAEAIAAEVQKKFGIDLFGIKIAGKGSVNYGAGAHAKAGFVDGKIVYDIGAAVGFGGGVSVEIDVSEKLNELYEQAKPAFMVAEIIIGDNGENIGASVEMAKRLKKVAEYANRELSIIR